MATFFALVMALGWVVSWYLREPVILWGAMIFSLLMNVSAYWFSDKVALAASGAHGADGVEYLELHRIVENLAITAGLPKPRVYIIDDAAPNAFAAGRDQKHAVVAVTKGLLGRLSHRT